jgi:hypothetical protein
VWIGLKFLELFGYFLFQVLVVFEPNFKRDNFIIESQPEQTPLFLLATQYASVKFGLRSYLKFQLVALITEDTV